jgi:hypothetical protein
VNFIDIKMHGATIKKSKLLALVTCNDMIQSSRFTTESPVEVDRKLKKKKKKKKNKPLALKVKNNRRRNSML